MKLFLNPNRGAAASHDRIMNMKANVTNWKTVLEYAALPKPAAPAKLPRALRPSHFDAETLVFVVTMLAVTIGDVWAFFWMFQ